jgi:hypothetical protein
VAINLNILTKLAGPAGAALALLFTSPAAAAQPCDRACLEAMVDRYLKAMVAKDLARLPLAPQVRYVESHQPLEPGEGSWRTIDGLGTYRHYFADPKSGHVGVIATVREHGYPGIFDLRLKVEDRRITEIETLMIRDPAAFDRYEAMRAPEPVWLEAVPPAERLSRAQMIVEVNKYLQGMQRNDGRGDYSFFHPQCNRIEHGLVTTNLKTREAYGHSTDVDFRSMTCEQQFKLGFLGFVTEIRDRRFLMVDEERQVVLAFATLDHNGTPRELPQTNGKIFVLPTYFDVPRTLQVQEGFKLKDGKLYRIEMTLAELPYGIRPPWPDSVR